MIAKPVHELHRNSLFIWYTSCIQQKERWAARLLLVVASWMHPGWQKMSRGTALSPSGENDPDMFSHLPSIVKNFKQPWKVRRQRPQENRWRPALVPPTAICRTKILHDLGFDSIRILILWGDILQDTCNSPEDYARRILVCELSVSKMYGQSATKNQDVQRVGLKQILNINVNGWSS